jgi:hypothetical protein
MRDQVSDPCKTTGKIMVLYSQCLYFWIEKWKTRDFAPNDSKRSRNLFCFQVVHEWNFDSLGLFQNVGNVPPFHGFITYPAMTNTLHNVNVSDAEGALRVMRVLVIIAVGCVTNPSHNKDRPKTTGECEVF